MLADIYVLGEVRSAALAERFLEQFLPNRVAAASEFEIPQYADQPCSVFSSAAELIRHCAEHPDVQHAVYWNNADALGDPRAAHVYYLPDGGMILGLSTRKTEPQLQDRLFAELQELVGSSVGYIAIEQPPVFDSKDFRRLASNASQNTQLAR